ncbi:6-phospho-beta-glucosidase [Paenibacillus thiaminolyticus]|uniref:6-phospho-beta-glucosidase n=1 Tax=Paenibacillus thiaminolyticus TaxID=49283 RepID=A0AAP9DSM1_PANTH|nr:6-phospho-beta-glucosidase [Paenibacillus thiaminolyticus]MCY9533483.1 6-phospho-beta-glucosidase [Paenibacillus thiaminolyticus]MCY9604148.1 6-phospho-beta-glucosidase [Paenibacillus thiaminolyticus]MCY9606304.1 6-phospho-beta-glucosidase [Paenibacillus thiaminolyticus]MCY9612054.1 6-phospho-beta-glucosidase [Paenibacillus thiaminolyticus]MCY9618075.1 6-phospho-beta-glucosidase [Paenibacillus thiaminolyticus]
MGDNNGLKIAVIGGGSSYTPEIVEGFIRNYEQMPIRELWLVDIEQGKHKLDIVGKLAKRMVQESGFPIDVHLTLDRERAIEGADFVTTQMRVGLLEARKRDEHIPIQHGVIGQETTGPGGMMKALRTIPVLLEICRDMERLAPNAWMLNFTNPAGIVTEAVAKHSRVRSIGLCNSPINVKKFLAAEYGVSEAEVLPEFVGINHLHWVTSAAVKGEEKLPELLAGGKAYNAKNVPTTGWDPEFLVSLGAIPTYYLKYYYQRDEMFEEMKESLAKNGMRADVVSRVETELFELYKDESLREKPKQLEQRGGAYYSEAAVNLMNSIYNDKHDIQTLNVLNGNIYDFLPADASIEVNCVVTKQGPIPLPPRWIPEHIKGLLHAVKTYEQLTIEAAVTGDRGIALQAMVHHPLVPSVRVAKALLDEMLEANRAYLPHFFKQ